MHLKTAYAPTRNKMGSKCQPQKSGIFVVGRAFIVNSIGIITPRLYFYEYIPVPVSENFPSATSNPKCKILFSLPNVALDNCSLQPHPVFCYIVMGRRFEHLTVASVMLETNTGLADSVDLRNVLAFNQSCDDLSLRPTSEAQIFVFP